MKKITIQATQAVIVTPDLEIRDLTDLNSTAPNKLRAVMDWKDLQPVKISQGVGEYNAHIKEWQTVKALVKAKVLTISESVEETTQPQTQASETMNKIKNKLKLD